MRPVVGVNDGDGHHEKDRERLEDAHEEMLARRISI
jgi:hypothetical protein